MRGWLFPGEGLGLLTAEGAGSDLSRTYFVIKAVEEFKEETTTPNQL
jgi:hypothetical protein